MLCKYSRVVTASRARDEDELDRVDATTRAHEVSKVTAGIPSLLSTSR